MGSTNLAGIDNNQVSLDMGGEKPTAIDVLDQAMASVNGAVLSTPSQEFFDDTIRENKDYYNVREGENRAENIERTRNALGRVDGETAGAVSLAVNEPQGKGFGRNRTPIPTGRGDIHPKRALQPQRDTAEKTGDTSKRSRIRTLGIGITTDFIQHGWIDLRGQKITSVDDIATLAAILKL